MSSSIVTSLLTSSTLQEGGTTITCTAPPLFTTDPQLDLCHPKNGPSREHQHSHSDHHQHHGKHQRHPALTNDEMVVLLTLALGETADIAISSSSFHNSFNDDKDEGEGNYRSITQE
jgi:hypothetical protein